MNYNKFKSIGKKFESNNLGIHKKLLISFDDLINLNLNKLTNFDQLFKVIQYENNSVNLND